MQWLPAREGLSAGETRWERRPIPGLLLALLLLAAACQTKPRPQADGATSRICVRPEEGCPCEGEQTTPCYLPQTDPNVCVEGTRYCTDGLWSACADVERYAAPVAVKSQALLDVGRATGTPVPVCDSCNQICFKAVDELNPADGPLDATNSSGSTLYASPQGITLESGMFGLPPGTLPPTGVGNNMPIVATLLPGDSVTTVLNSIAPAVNKLDIYFLIELDDSMGEELSSLTSELNGTTDYIGGVPCVDADYDGLPDAHGTGLAEAIRCWAKDPWFGVGYFREIPYAPHAGKGQVAYSHVQDMDADAALTESALGTMVTQDLSPYADIATSELVALSALATRVGFNMGAGNPSLPVRTDCPSGTRGYPCFRDDAVALVLVLTDRPVHGGPVGYDYAAMYQQPQPADVVIDATSQPSGGSAATPYAVGDVSSLWTRFDGTTSAAVQNALPAGTVGCGADGSTGDAIHTFTVSGLAASATLPITLTTQDSAFDTTISLHSGPPVPITAVTVPVSNNALTDTEASAFPLPDGSTNIYAHDVTVTGANSSGLGSEVTPNLMGCLGNDGTAPDAVYRFDVGPEGADVAIDTAGSSFDTVVALFKDYVKPVSKPWSVWVEYDEFFEEGWDDWNRNGDGILCTGGLCNQDWTCDSGAPNKRCGFYMTGTNPRIDDVDCTNGSTCVFVINAPGQDVLIDSVNVTGGSTFYVKVIAANEVEFDRFYCEDTSKCGFDYGNVPATSTTDINCEGSSFCYMVHNNGTLGELDVNDTGKLQIECGSGSNCGKGVSDCDHSSFCVLKRAPSTQSVGLDCDHNTSACICLEGNGGSTGCQGFCDSSAAAVCANPRGQLVLSGGGPSIPGSVQRLACDDNSGPGTSSLIYSGPLDPGTYYVVVKGKQGGQAGNYSLHIRDRSVDNRLACNDDEIVGVTHSKIPSYALGNGTYYAVVKGGAAAAEGDYSLWVGVEPPPFTYTPPTYAQTIADLNAEDLRVSSAVSCDLSDSACVDARNDGIGFAFATRAVVDPGTGTQPLSYMAAPDASDLGAQLLTSVQDLSQYLALDVTWRVVDQSIDPTLDPNPFSTSIAPDDATLCQGISGTWYLGCQMGEVPSHSVTFTNPPSPGNVPDNSSDPNGGYGFLLQMVGRTPSAGAAAPLYTMEEVPVYLIPNNSIAPAVPGDGTYSQTLESRACSSTIRPDWQALFYKAYLPLGTSIGFHTCAAPTEPDLASCTPRELVTATAVAACGAGCPPGSVCASGLPNITPNDVCVAFSSSVMCNVAADCPAGLTCQNGICAHSDGSPDIATVLQGATKSDRWTRYDIDLKADAARTLSPTLDYWDVTYVCGVLD